MSVATKIAEVRSEIKQLEKKYDRVEGSVKLIAVSKTKSVAMIREAYHAGQKYFAENYVQEISEKSYELTDVDIEWHFIGPIQSNKTKKIAELVHWVHSVDRIKTAKRLSDQRPHDLPDLNICLQVNVNAEATKAGFSCDEALSAATEIMRFPRLCLRGLMAIPERTEDIDLQRKSFSILRELKNAVQSQLDVELDTLSMGMSSDIEAAIAEGASMVRIGTGIFGARDYEKF